jgi:acetylglutamate kinase
MSEFATSSDAVLKAAAQARSLRGRTIVVKLGGSALEDAAASRGTLECIVALHTLGVRMVLIHGGGKRIDRAMEQAGIQPVKVQGRRYTDEKTLGIVVNVLKQINGELGEQIEAWGGTCIAYAAADIFPLDGERLLMFDSNQQPLDLGRVGRVTAVHPALEDGFNLHHEQQWDDYQLPIVASIARDAQDGLLNVNADTVASAVAGAFRSPAALFLTDTPGVLFDRNDPTSRFVRLTQHHCKELITSGVISGGMIPKVEACLDALDAGAERAVILDGRDPHSLLHWLLGESVGTEFTR